MSCVVGCGGAGGGGSLGPGRGLELRGVRGGRPPARPRQGPARQHRARRQSLVTIFGEHTTGAQFLLNTSRFYIVDSSFLRHLP